jgi:hypothetical protein
LDSKYFRKVSRIWAAFMGAFGGRFWGRFWDNP